MAISIPAFNHPQDSCNAVLDALRDSSLNLLVSESPYSIQICIRKRFLKDAPQQKLRNDPLSTTVKSLEKNCETLANENATLVEALEEADKALQSSKSTNDILHNKMDRAENELFENHTEKKDIETKAKETKKKLNQEIDEMQSKLQAVNKENKSKDKQIHDLNKTINAARDTIKNLKEEKSSLKISKTKLDSEVRNLEKKVHKKVVSAVKQTQTESKALDPEIDSSSFLTPPSSTGSKSCRQEPTVSTSPASPNSLRSPDSMSTSPLTPSMVSHWFPVPHQHFQSPLPSMIPHCAESPESSASPPAENSTEPFNLYSAATWAPLQLAVKNLEETMNKLVEKHH
jgi:cell division septum initiation protein DivIVA